MIFSSRVFVIACSGSLAISPRMWLRSSERFLVSSRPCCSVKSSVSFRPHRNRVADSCNTVFVLFCHTCVWQCIAVINALCTRTLCGMSLIIRGGRDSPGGHEFHVPPAEPGVKQRSIFCWCCLIWEDSVSVPVPVTSCWDSSSAGWICTTNSRMK